MNSLAVEVSNLSFKVQDRFILKNINLKVKEGEFLGIVGPNGGGKTTLLKLILGLHSPTEGYVKIFNNKPERLLGTGIIGYLPQRIMPDRNFPASALDVVLMGLYKKGKIFFSEEDKNKAVDILGTMSMDDKKDRPFGALSGGEQQRVLIAQALVKSPKVLLLDEPSTGIDVIGQEDFYQLLIKLKEEKGITVILVTHDTGVITSYADEFACLNTTIHYHGGADSAFNLEKVMKNLYQEQVDVIKHKNNCKNCEREK